MLRAIPLLIIVVALYFAGAIFNPELFDNYLLEFTLPSGDQWKISSGTLLVALGLLLLYLEIVKATRTSQGSIIDHGLSTFLFIICLIAFLILPKAGTSTFFLITLMTLLDVIAGFTVSITAARRDFTYGGDGGGV